MSPRVIRFADNMAIFFHRGTLRVCRQLWIKGKDLRIPWPTVGIGTLLPVPDSLLGNVSIDYEWAYSIYLANSTREDYEKYVEKCINSGFDKDVRNYGDSVWADYSEKISLNVSYEGCDTMYVSIRGSLNEDYSMYKRKSDSE